jgi:hypothetical protein
MLILRHWDSNFKTIFRWFTIGILCCDQVGSAYGLQPDEYTILVWTLMLTNIEVGYDLRQYHPYTSTGLVGRPKVISSIYLTLYPHHIMFIPASYQAIFSLGPNTSTRLGWEFPKGPNTKTRLVQSFLKIPNARMRCIVSNVYTSVRWVFEYTSQY